jgi:hypothetical protein
MPVEGGVRPIQLTVRRHVLLEDAYAALAGLGAGVKARLMVGVYSFACSRRHARSALAAVHGRV